MKFYLKYAKTDLLNYAIITIIKIDLIFFFIKPYIAYERFELFANL